MARRRQARFSPAAFLLLIFVLAVVGILAATVAVIINDDNCPELAKRFGGSAACGAGGAPGEMWPPDPAAPVPPG